MIELKEYIKKALLDIVEGIEEANSVKKDRFQLNTDIQKETKEYGTQVNFDVTILINDLTSKKGEGKAGGTVLSVVSANLSGSMEKANTMQNTQHLSFKVFIKEK